MARRLSSEGDQGRLKASLLLEMTHHVGRGSRIGMGELYERIYGVPWANRINDTRRLRKLVTELRKEGVPICSDSTSSGGYWLASAGSELDGYCRRLRGQALRKLTQEAKLRKMTLPELVGQLHLELEPGANS